MVWRAFIVVGCHFDLQVNKTQNRKQTTLSLEKLSAEVGITKDSHTAEEPETLRKTCYIHVCNI